MAIAKFVSIASLMVSIAVSPLAQADSSELGLDAGNMKRLVGEALRTGQSDGELTGKAARVFKNHSHSDAPVKLHIVKIKNYANGCGRLRFEMSQSITDSNGKQQQLTPWFELNLCKDGDPPHEAIQAAQENEKRMFQACHVKIVRGKVDNQLGGQLGELIATGCPADGLSHWRYDGDCPSLKMGLHDSTNTPIQHDGSIRIKMVIPKQCFGYDNKWLGQIVAGEPIGIVHVKW